jgi:hypothetical protein
MCFVFYSLDVLKKINQLLKNMLFLGRAMLPVFLAEPVPEKLPRGRVHGKSAAATPAASSDAVDSEGDNSGDEGDEESGADAVKRSGLLWTFKQMMYIAKQETAHRPTVTFRCFSVYFFASFLMDVLL